MKVLDLKCDNFRNLNITNFSPEENVNIIYGDNAQGKTNILEAIWIFTGGRSFRGSSDRELVSLNSEKKVAQIDMKFFSEQREKTGTIKIENGKRKNFINSLPITSSAEMVGNFCSVIFSPSHLSLIQEGPSERRKFLDAAICQIKPSYIKSLTCYNKALYQRNLFFKQNYRNTSLQNVIQAWNITLSQYCSEVLQRRIEYIKSLKPIANEIYNGFSNGKEIFDIEYSSSCTIPYELLNEKKVTADKLQPYILQSLENSLEKDKKVGYTTVGCHRDDIDIKINSISARSYGSQGQQRSCVLALKIAEATLLEEYICERPVVLFDDVMSELDPKRQDYILNQMKDWQVFVTCCEPSTILRMTKGKAFKIEKGSILVDN